MSAYTHFDYDVEQQATVRGANYVVTGTLHLAFQTERRCPSVGIFADRAVGVHFDSDQVLDFVNVDTDERFELGVTAAEANTGSNALFRRVLRAAWPWIQEAADALARDEEFEHGRRCGREGG